MQRDYSRFLKGTEKFRHTRKKGYYFVDFPDEVFPKNWLNSEVPVFFDFCGLSTSEQDKIKKNLWCLLPQKHTPQTIVFGLEKNELVRITHNNSRF